MMPGTETIVAESSPSGRGGVSVVRVSGPDLLALAKSLLGRVPGARIAHHCLIKNADGEAIDDCLLLFFPSPHSFTGEDAIEVQCHGSPIVVDQICQNIINLGARPARPGEFSERAFLNGKIDLTQAEAIADLIDSNTVAAARSALRSLSGHFSRKINELASRLRDLRVLIEATIDFPEEEVDYLDDERIENWIKELKCSFSTLLNSTQQGCILREGIRLVLAGKPNVGKSSLLNLLCREDKAIVTAHPGTTRDILEHFVQLDGYPVHLMDTAGLRSTNDPIEREGVNRSKQVLRTADLVAYIVDSNDFENASLQADIEALQPLQRLLLVFNKIDLNDRQAGSDHRYPEPAVNISVTREQGIETLKKRIIELAAVQQVDEQTFTARRRHLYALQFAREHLLAGEKHLLQDRSGELLAEELRLAQQKLGEITGEMTADDLLGEIFSRFCIGK